MLMAAALSVYVVSRTSGDELRGAYRESARASLKAAAAGFEAGPRDAADLREFARTHPDLESVSLRGPAGRAVTVGRRTDGDEVLVTRLGDRRELVLSYDMRPVQRSLDERNRRVLICLLYTSDAADEL